jgi:hypothetical protein
VNHIRFTKNFHIKGSFYFLFLLFISSCSPTVYVLDKTPKIAGHIYKKTTLTRIQNKLKNDQSNIKYKIRGVENLTTYAFGFLIEESDRLMLNDYSKAKALESEAHQYFVDAVSYGDSSISHLYSDYYQWMCYDTKTKIIPNSNMKSSDFELLYWTAAAYGGAISSSGGDPEWIIKLPRIGKLLNSIIEFNPNWNNGAALVALISYSMNDPLLSSKEADAIAKDLFKSAIKASSGKDMGPYLTYAESVSKTRQNKDEFIYLLNEALKINIKSAKQFQLTNIISKNRAEWLLDNIDEFFY